MSTIVDEMATTQTTPATKEINLELRATLERLATAVAFCVLLVVVGVYLAVPVLAYSWTQLPFMGAFIEPTLIFNGVGSSGWALLQDGGPETHYPDRLVSVDGVEAETPAAFNRLMANYAVGDSVEIVIERATADSPFGPYKVGDKVPVVVTLTSFALPDLLNYFITPYFIGLAFLAIGLWVFYLRRDEASGRVFHLSDDEGPTWEALVEGISRAVAVRPRIIRISDAAARIRDSRAQRVPPGQL
ncbi:MAG: hypothetical protein AAB658_03670, partial [Chloroflexota bacterium]